MENGELLASQSLETRAAAARDVLRGNHLGGASLDPAEAQLVLSFVIFPDSPPTVEEIEKLVATLDDGLPPAA